MSLAIPICLVLQLRQPWVFPEVVPSWFELCHRTCFHKNDWHWASSAYIQNLIPQELQKLNICECCYIKCYDSKLFNLLSNMQPILMKLQSLSLKIHREHSLPAHGKFFNNHHPQVLLPGLLSIPPPSKLLAHFSSLSRFPRIASLPSSTSSVTTLQACLGSF